jgi:hypothetical protein
MVALALVVAGCAGLQVEPEARLGQMLPGTGLVVGAGRLDGVAWNVGATSAGGLVCTTATWGGGQRQTCSGPAAAGRNNASVGFGLGEPIVVEGFTDDRVALVQVEDAQGIWDVQPVPLTGLALPGSAFGIVLPAGTTLRAVHFLDASGNRIERQDLPAIQISPPDQGP